MRLYLAAITILSLCLPAPTCANAPDFTWGRGRAAVLLVQSQQAWTAARSPLASSQSPFEVLNAALERFKLLEQSRVLYSQALMQARPSAASRAALAEYEDAFFSTRSSLRLAAGAARAQISVSMADTSTWSYCMQSLEAAIDSLRDAAADARRSSHPSLPADKVEQLRGYLFRAWEQAQKDRDPQVIKDLDLAVLLDSIHPQTSTISEQVDQ